MADKRISQLIERTDIANNDVLPIVASGATTTNKVTISTIQDWMQSNLDVGVTSVGLTMPSAFQVSGSPITTSGNINVTATGTASQYIRGDGSLADFPQGGGGGGASVSYYLNGSVSQGTIGGVAYQELSKTPILGAGTDFNISADGYIASFITDAGDPALLQIPAGNWNFETYLQASSGGGTPTFYIELYKVDSGGTATLIASNSGSPELIAFGTIINPYFSALAVPQTTLALTDRLAIRYYVTHSGRTITLHTENNTLCQIITTFTTGLTALNGLTAQVQNFATGTSGTNFGITSSGSIHTFNLPDASASARGVVTTGSQVFGGVKTFADGLSLPSAGGTNQASRFVNIGTIHQGSGGSNQIGFNNSNNIYFGKGLDNGGVIQWNNSAVRYYTIPDSDGTIAMTSDLGNYVTIGTTQTITGAKIFSSTLTVNTPSNGIGVLLNGRTSDNFSSIRFGANTGGGQYNAISANASSLDISSLGATPITFSTDTQGGGGTRMTISGTGAVTLTGALNGTTASFNNLVNITASGGGAAINIRGRSVDDIGQILFFDNNGSTLRNIIQSQPSTLAIYSQGNTPITFGTNNAGGGGTRMTIGGDGTITLAGALNGTTATFLSGSSSTIGLVVGGAGGVGSTRQGQIRFGDAGTVYKIQGGEDYSAMNFMIGSGTPLSIASNAAATFSSSVTAASANLNRSSLTASNPLLWSTSGTLDWFLGSSPLGNSTSDLSLYSYGTSSVVFHIAKSSGNVGIGTASPSRTLDIKGSGGVATVLKLEGAVSSTFLQLAYNGATPSQSGYIGYDGSSNMSFLINDTERMRITSGGFTKSSNTGAYFGSTGAYHELISNANADAVQIIQHRGSNPFGMYMNFTTNPAPNNTSNYFIAGGDVSTTRFFIYSNGNITNTNGSYGAISDIKLKENIEDATPKLDDLMKVKVRNYNLIGEDKKQIGVIAQELEEVFPAMIDESEDFEEVEVPQVDEEGNEILNEEGEVLTTKERVSKGTTTKSVKYSVFVPMLIKAMQEQQEQIKSLTEQVEALKSQING